MTRTILTAAVAVLALTATAADARQSARQRGVASGQEAKERAATKELNAQQLANAGAVGSAAMTAPATSATSATPPMTPTAPDAASSTMPPPAEPMMSPSTATPEGAMPPAAAMTPDAAAAPDAAMTPPGEATPATDPVPPTPQTPPEPR